MGVIRMVGSTGKRYGEEFKLMILEMHKKGKTIRELSSEYKISPHTIYLIIVIYIILIQMDQSHLFRACCTKSK